MNGDPIAYAPDSDQNAFSASVTIGEDSFAAGISGDSDQDGVADMAISVIDGNGDGSIDAIGVDTDGDGKIDIVTVDINSDGIGDIIGTPDRCEEIWGGVPQSADSQDEMQADVKSDTSMGLGGIRSKKDAGGNLIETITEVGGRIIRRDAGGNLISIES